MFERIQKELDPTTVAIGKYDATFVNKPARILATIDEGKEFQRLFLSKMGYRKAFGAIKSTALLAQRDMAGGTYVNVEEMLSDRFPTDKPIDLYFEVEQGSDRDTTNDFGGEERNPNSTNGQFMARVRDLIEVVLKDRKDDGGWKRIFREVDLAAEYSASLSAPQEPATHQAPPTPPAPLAPPAAQAPAAQPPPVSQEEN